MAKAKLIIKGELPALNQHIAAMNRNRYVGAKVKKEATELVRWEAIAQGLEVRSKPVIITYHWHMKNKKKDLDNICYAKKFINDGLVKAGVLYDDSHKWVKGFEDKFYLDRENPRIEVILRYAPTNLF